MLSSVRVFCKTFQSVKGMGFESIKSKFHLPAWFMMFVGWVSELAGACIGYMLSDGGPFSSLGVGRHAARGPRGPGLGPDRLRLGSLCTS